MKLPRLLHTLLMLCALLCGGPALHAQTAGNLDPAFAPSVQVTAVSVIAVQPDGKTIIGGDFHTSLFIDGNFHTFFGLARLNVDGTVDTTFVSGLIPGRMVSRLALLPNGKMLICSRSSSATVSSWPGDLFSRLNADGTVDATFTPPSNYVETMAVQPDGKVLLAGLFPHTQFSPTSYFFDIVRLNADGSTDSTFDTAGGIKGGSVTSPGSIPALGPSPVNGMAVQTDGKILVKGSFTLWKSNLGLAGTPRNQLARLNADGSLDTTFDPGSVLTGGSYMTIASMAPLDNGKILVTGDFSGALRTPAPKIVRLNADGTLDGTFNSVPDADTNNPFSLLTAQVDGKILVGGRFATVNGEARVKIARLNADGSLESTTTFDAGSGIGTSGDIAQPLALVLQADGRILVGGDFTTVNGQPRNRMARLLNDAASQTLTVVDPTHVEWLRSGSAPAASQVEFQVSRDGGASWTKVGSAERFASGWRLAGSPLASTGMIRVVAVTPGGLIVSPSQAFTGLPVFTMTTSVSPLVAFSWYVVVGGPQPPSGTVTGGGMVPVGSPVSLVATPAMVYEFVNWTENGTPVSTSATYQFTPTSDRTLVANFALQTFPITASVASPGGGVVRGGGTFNYSTWVSLVASPAPGYSFANWSENGTVVSTQAAWGITALAPRTVVASFTRSTYTVSTVASPELCGTVTGGGTFSHGAPVRLVAVPAAGCQFVNWSEDGKVMNWGTTLNFTATGNRTLTANFTQIAPISGGANFTGANIFSGAGIVMFGSGTLYVGNSAYAGETTFLLKTGLALISLGAPRPVTYTITAGATPATGGWAVGAGDVYSGGAVTLLAEPAPGFTFANWTENGAVVSTSASYAFTADSNRTLIANFTGNSNASLGSLASDQVAFPVTFDDSVTTYAAKVTAKTKYFTLMPTFAQDGATMKINGAAASPGGNSAAIPLHLGDNPITIEVTATDGVTTRTYTVNVTQSAVPRDLDGDGNPDIILQNTAGQVGAWYMDAAGRPFFSAIISSTALGDWKVVGTVDMNGDGFADMIYQNSFGQIVVWYLDGLGKMTSGAFLWSGGLGDWKVVAAADINGDGHSDLIFQNGIGQVVVWYMNGAGVMSSGGFLCSSWLGDWHIVAVADMDNDGKPDILLQNTVGQIFAWHLNHQNGAAVIATGSFLYGGGLSDWRLMNAGDMNWDGNADLLLQNGIGQIFVWYMNGSGGISKSGFIYGGGLGDWRVK